MKLSNLSRLSDLNIEDDVIRSYLYREILNAIRKEAVNCQSYEIKPDEKYRADLVSLRVYGTIEASWLVMLLCDVEEGSDPLPVAADIQFPPASYIRERIRHFAEGGGLENA